MLLHHGLGRGPWCEARNQGAWIPGCRLACFIFNSLWSYRTNCEGALCIYQLCIGSLAAPVGLSMSNLDAELEALEVELECKIITQQQFNEQRAQLLQNSEHDGLARTICNTLTESFSTVKRAASNLTDREEDFPGLVDVLQRTASNLFDAAKNGTSDDDDDVLERTSSGDRMRRMRESTDGGMERTSSLTRPLRNLGFSFEESMDALEEKWKPTFSAPVFF